MKPELLDEIVDHVTKALRNGNQVANSLLVRAVVDSLLEERAKAPIAVDAETFANYRDVFQAVTESLNLDPFGTDGATVSAALRVLIDQSDAYGSADALLDSERAISAKMAEHVDRLGKIVGLNLDPALVYSTAEAEAACRTIIDRYERFIRSAERIAGELGQNDPTKEVNLPALENVVGDLLSSNRWLSADVESLSEQLRATAVARDNAVESLASLQSSFGGMMLKLREAGCEATDQQGIEKSITLLGISKDALIQIAEAAGLTPPWSPEDVVGAVRTKLADGSAEAPQLPPVVGESSQEKGSDSGSRAQVGITLNGSTSPNVRPWVASYSPQQCQMAIRLFAQGKQPLEVAAAVDLKDRKTAMNLRAAYSREIDFCRSRPEGPERDNYLASLLRQFNGRLEAAQSREQETGGADG